MNPIYKIKKRVTFAEDTCFKTSDVEYKPMESPAVVSKEEPGDHHAHNHHRHKKKGRTKLQRVRKRLTKYLHTHVALIIICTLSALDAACVLGQIICDILIMKEQIHEKDLLMADAEHLLVKAFPDYFNETVHGHITLVKVVQILDDMFPLEQSRTSNHYLWKQSYSARRFYERNRNFNPWNSWQSQPRWPLYGGNSRRIGGNFRVKRVSGFAADIDHAGHAHTLLHELTHAFHLGSMVILSLLVLETFFKIFAMGKKILHHKLEVFDAFVVTVSWCLDVAFWEGIWAKPGEEAATVLIFILPWRVIRIVNSFVLVIQEKDLVTLKLVKQRYRSAVKKIKEITQKVDMYRLEVRQLQGLARKHAATENEISACNPLGKRRRSSLLLPALNSLASVALIGAVGSVPDLVNDYSSSSDDDDTTCSELSPNDRRYSTDTLNTVSSDVTFSLSPDGSTTPGTGSSVFTFPPTFIDIKNDKNTGTNTKL